METEHIRKITISLFHLRDSGVLKILNENNPGSIKAENLNFKKIFYKFSICEKPKECLKAKEQESPAKNCLQDEKLSNENDPTENQNRKIFLSETTEFNKKNNLFNYVSEINHFETLLPKQKEANVDYIIKFTFKFDDSKSQTGNNLENAKTEKHLH